MAVLPGAQLRDGWQLRLSRRRSCLLLGITLLGCTPQRSKSDAGKANERTPARAEPRPTAASAPAGSEPCGSDCLERATVRLLSGDGAEAIQICWGVVVAVDRWAVVATAAHCLASTQPDGVSGGTKWVETRHGSRASVLREVAHPGFHVGVPGSLDDLGLLATLPDPDLQPVPAPGSDAPDLAREVPLLAVGSPHPIQLEGWTEHTLRLSGQALTHGASGAGVLLSAGGHHRLVGLVSSGPPESGLATAVRLGPSTAQVAGLLASGQRWPIPPETWLSTSESCDSCMERITGPGAPCERIKGSVQIERCRNAHGCGAACE